MILDINSGEAMRAERERKLAAVVQIVFDHMPDDPLARKFV